MRERYSVAKQNYTNKHEFVVLAVVARQYMMTILSGHSYFTTIRSIIIEVCTCGKQLFSTQ